MAIALKAKDAHPLEPIFLLGAPVHNEEALSFLKEKGLSLLDGDFPSLEENLSSLPEGSVVVFSAHGHPKRFEEIASEKGFALYDGTCSFVRNNQEEGLKRDGPIIYVGERGHAEKKAFLANCPTAYFYDAADGSGNWRDCPAPPRLICQTTLSGQEVRKAVSEIGARFPSFRLSKERCTATRLRQEEVFRLSKAADCAVILGSRTSNNTKKLSEIASLHCPAFLCLDENEVKLLDLSGKDAVLVASGASTSSSTVEKTVAYLSSL